MENLLLTVKEYRYVRKHKLNFETRYHVKLILPEVDENNGGYCANDIIFATILGDQQNIGIVKDILKLKTEALNINQDSVISSSNAGDNVPIITLSDSDPDTPTLAALSENNVNKQKKRRKSAKKTIMPSIAIPSVSSATEASSDCNPNRKRKLAGTISSTTESFAISYKESCTTNIQDKGGNKKLKEQPLVSVNQSTVITKESSIVTSSATTSQSANDSTSTITSQSANDSIVVLGEWAPIDEFIPLNSRIGKNGSKGKVKSGKKQKNTKQTNNADDSVVILDDDVIELNEVTVPRPISKDPRLLRPIIIDGSNVARYHGKALNTFSCKGIQISVDYFLKRGHTQITVFVPLFRRHKTLGPFPTTDPGILEELEMNQRLVFTPSRNLNGKKISCYDDRFIVELASTTEGVILSNDNFKDLVDVEGFKKTIEERLLMFVFVGDKIMIPNDPLGRNGPSLDEFLSLPSGNILPRN